MICTVAAALRGGPINRVDIESDIQMKSHKSAEREVALKRPNRKGNVTENYEGSGCPIDCGTRRINYARGVRIRTSHDPFPALSFSLSLCISPLKASASAKTYLPWSDSCKSGTMLCVVATWSRHARLHIKRRSSSSRRQTEPTHSKRGRNGRRTPSRPQNPTDDRTHLHACPVCRVSLSRATPAPSSIVSYDE